LCVHRYSDFRAGQYIEVDCEPSVDIAERYERLLQRVELNADDPMSDYLRDYLFSEFQPV